MSVPLYSSDLALLDVISEKRALRLEDCGLAKLVRHKGLATDEDERFRESFGQRSQASCQAARKYGHR